MDQEIRLNGIVLSSAPQGESDRRIILLSSEFGKITVFANGARRPKSHLAAATRSFTMGEFSLRQGRTAYTLLSAEITETFDALSSDMEKFCFASYMCELAGYYTRENVRARDELNLLYVSFKYLLGDKPDYKLAKAVYELRLMEYEGEGLQVNGCTGCGKEDARYISIKERGLICDDCIKKKNVSDTVLLTENLKSVFHHICHGPLTRLYALSIDEAEKDMVMKVADKYVGRFIDRKFKSLEILDSLY